MSVIKIYNEILVVSKNEVLAVKQTKKILNFSRKSVFFFFKTNENRNPLSVTQNFTALAPQWTKEKSFNLLIKVKL